MTEKIGNPDNNRRAQAASEMEAALDEMLPKGDLETEIRAAIAEHNGDVKEALADTNDAQTRNGFDGAGQNAGRRTQALLSYAIAVLRGDSLGGFNSDDLSAEFKAELPDIIAKSGAPSLQNSLAMVEEGEKDREKSSGE